MNIKSEEEWAERAAAFLKHKLKDTETTYAELAKRLRKHGLKETEASIANKLSRGTFPATFFLACIAALELQGGALEEFSGGEVMKRLRFGVLFLVVALSSPVAPALSQTDHNADAQKTERPETIKPDAKPE